MIKTITTVTAPMHRKMHVLWREYGISDRNQRIAITSIIIRRKITSSNQLSRNDAHTVIDQLDNGDAHAIIDAGDIF